MYVTSSLLGGLSKFWMFFKAETVYFRFFNFSTLLTWIFPACEPESEHNDPNSAQIRKYQCLGGKVIA